MSAKTGAKNDFQERMDELTDYYNTHDDISNGIFLKNKKYWYLWFNCIQYGYVDATTLNASNDVTSLNRVTYYESVTFKSKDNHLRSVLKLDTISDTRKGILKIYANYIKYDGLESSNKKFLKLSKVFPELAL